MRSARYPPPSSAHLSQNRILRPGLSFHFGSEAESEDRVGCGRVEDQVRIVLVLEGALDIAYGDSPLELAAQGPRRADAAVVALSEPEEFRRVIHRGDYARRISIGLERQWIEQSLLGDTRVAATESERFLRRHLSTSCWRASPHARAIAEQMLNPPPLPSGLVGMYLESRAIELVLEAWSRQGALTGTAAPPARGLRPAAFRRMCELKAWLQENAAATLSIERICAHAGTSPATLQRHFRLAHGMSVFEFLQRTRLQQARHALEYAGADVSAAALIAGYSNPANFATAFKRHYGLSPGQVRYRA
ncbi:MAG: AraC family transcriptional regulator [Pseudomonas sp.]